VSSVAWEGFIKQFEMKFVSLLAWDGLAQHILICILSPFWHERGLANTI
jgi:hypothetical protein